jgi:hypothetical protein
MLIKKGAMKIAPFFTLWGHSPFSCGDTPQEESWLMRRVPQISKGKILGTAAFVAEAIAKYQSKFNSHRVRVRVVVDGMFASHGYRLVCSVRRTKRSVA